MEASQTLTEGTMTPLAWPCDFFSRGFSAGSVFQNTTYYFTSMAFKDLYSRNSIYHCENEMNNFCIVKKTPFYKRCSNPIKQVMKLPLIATGMYGLVAKKSLASSTLSYGWPGKSYPRLSSFKPQLQNRIIPFSLVHYKTPLCCSLGCS